MRWKIVTKEEINKVNETQSEKKTIVTRSQYITVGDIVGAGKSAAGGVQKLAKAMPGFINNLKSDPKGMAMAVGVNNIIQPLAVMITGMDEYKKVMGMIDSLTPIMKLVARASGVWCSPGNAADIAQIVLGTAQQLLIQIATSSILRLKEFVWNYEFKVRDISTETSVMITRKLKEYDKKNNIILNNGNIFDINKENEINYHFIEELKDIDKIIDKAFENKKSEVSFENIFNILQENKPTEEDKCKRRINYITEFPPTGIKRILSGSLNNKGIYYSDDNGETWIQSSLNNGSFNSFEKVLVDGKYIYVAGSTEEIIKVKPTLDIKPSKDSNGHYNKDYYNKDLIKLTKEYKDNSKDTVLFYDKEIFNKGIGIYYSVDNGLNWKISNLNDGRFELIKSFNNTLIASSYDYKGIYYSTDGKIWNHSTLNNKEINSGRWTVIDTLSDTAIKVTASSLKNINKFNIGKINTIEEINSLNTNMNVKVSSISYQGDTIIDHELYGKKINIIIEYLHNNYYEKVILKDNLFWEDLINKIINDEYTMEDAINGKDI